MNVIVIRVSKREFGTLIRNIHPAVINRCLVPPPVTSPTPHRGSEPSPMRNGYQKKMEKNLRLLTNFAIGLIYRILFFALFSKIIWPEKATANEYSWSKRPSHIVRLFPYFQSLDFKDQIMWHMRTFSMSVVSRRMKTLLQYVNEIFVSSCRYSIFEHNFRQRVGDEQRTYLSLPPIIAPYKCSVLPLSDKPDFAPFVQVKTTTDGMKL